MNIKTVTVGNREVEVCASQNAFALLEKELENPVHILLKNWSEHGAIGMRDFQALLWSMAEAARIKTKPNHPSVNFYQVGEWLDELESVKDISTIANDLMELIRQKSDPLVSASQQENQSPPMSSTDNT